MLELVKVVHYYGRPVSSRAFDRPSNNILHYCGRSQTKKSKTTHQSLQRVHAIDVTVIAVTATVATIEHIAVMFHDIILAFTFCFDLLISASIIQLTKNGGKAGANCLNCSMNIFQRVTAE